MKKTQGKRNKNAQKAVKPNFKRKLSKNSLKFFSPDADADFTAAHPKLYKLLEVVGIIVLLLPMVLYVIFALPNAPESPMLFVGLIGSFIIGVGLFNIVAAFLDQYLGTAFTIICFVFGIGLIVLTNIILNTKSIFDSFDHEMTSYFSISLLFSSIPLIGYALFRFSVDEKLRKKRISRSHINKLKKGKRNYWFYEQIQNEIGLGALYHINKAFIISSILLYSSLLLCFVFRYARLFSVPICIFSMSSELIGAIMITWSSLEDLKNEYGTCFFLFRRSSNNGFDSPLFAVGVLIFMLGMCRAQIHSSLELWGFIR